MICHLQLTHYRSWYYTHLFFVILQTMLWLYLVAEEYVVEIGKLSSLVVSFAYCINLFLITFSCSRSSVVMWDSKNDVVRWFIVLISFSFFTTTLIYILIYIWQKRLKPSISLSLLFVKFVHEIFLLFLTKSHALFANFFVPSSLFISQKICRKKIIYIYLSDIYLILGFIASFKVIDSWLHLALWELWTAHA